MDRDEAIQAIKAALKTRKLRFSVTGGRGTAWGWISVSPLPSVVKGLDHDGREAAYGAVNAAFGFSERGSNSVSIPASAAHRREYVERAKGLEPTTIAQAYWD